MSYYVILNVEPHATVAEIRAAYLKRALKVHPDKVGGNNADFQKLARAFEVLSAAARRFEHDKPYTGFGTTSGTCAMKPGGPVGHKGPCCHGPVGRRGSWDRCTRATAAFDRSRGLWGLRGSQL